ncbi:MAG TPA: hypothetical protein VF384_08505 [Planctomycetota bacterium]
MNSHVPASLATLALVALTTLPHSATLPLTPGVFPSNARPYGQSYAEWSASWWTFCMEHPVVGHPFLDDGQFDVTTGQSGNVWFLAAPFGTHTRTVTIPRGTALCVGLLNAEWSSLEPVSVAPPTYSSDPAVLEAIATSTADFITNVTCTLDGVGVDNIDDYRVVSPQFSFTAPDPWIFSAPDVLTGPGTAVADGYFVILRPLSVGQHVLHYSGEFDFGGGALFPLDMTYTINVQ